MKMRYLAVFLVFFSLSDAVPAQERMSVQVREGQLREQPSFLGRVAATVEYGDRVSIRETRGPWKMVSIDDKGGWIHESALTSKRVVLQAGDEDVGPVADREELALAGKGFSREVEEEFRAANRDLDFSRVDQMEREWGVSVEEVSRFLREGGLNGGNK